MSGENTALLGASPTFQDGPEIGHDPTRHEVNSARTQSAILQSALDSFSRHGLKGASLREIASNAGVQHALIRYHFKTKEDLWKAALAFLFERIKSEVSVSPAERASLSTRLVFSLWLRRYISYCSRHPEHARLLMQESADGGPLLTWSVDTYVRQNFLASRAMLAQLQKEGIIESLPLDSLAYILSAACQTVFVLANQYKALTDVDPSMPSFIEEHARTIEALILKA